MEINDDGELDRKTAEQVAHRVLALIAVIDKAHDQNAAWLDRRIATRKIRDLLSLVELAFVKNVEPTRQEIVDHACV